MMVCNHCQSAGKAATFYIFFLVSLAPGNFKFVFLGNF